MGLCSSCEIDIQDTLCNHHIRCDNQSYRSNAGVCKDQNHDPTNRIFNERLNIERPPPYNPYRH